MNARKILFPTDFSHTGDAALDFAASLAKQNGGTILIAHVEELPQIYGEGAMYYGLVEPSVAELNEMLHDVKPRDADVPFEHHLLRGEPVEALVRFAKDEGVDLIVLGSHGRTGLMRALMGSIAEGIVRRASCPVLVCKQPAPKPVTAVNN